MLDRALHYVAGDNRKDARADAAGRLVCDQLVNIAAVGERVGAVARVAPMRHVEYFALPSVGLQVPGVGHYLAFAVFSLHLDIAEVDVSPILRDTLGEANARAGYLRASAAIRIRRALCKAPTHTGRKNTLVRCALVARETLCDDHRRLYFLGLSRGRHRCGDACGVEFFRLISEYVQFVHALHSFFVIFLAGVNNAVSGSHPSRVILS